MLLTKHPPKKQKRRNALFYKNIKELNFMNKQHKHIRCQKLCTGKQICPEKLSRKNNVERSLQKLAVVS